MEDEKHVMFSCAAYSDMRKLLYEEIQQLGGGGGGVGEGVEERDKVWEWMKLMLGGSDSSVVTKSRKVEKGHEVAMRYQ